ncbi:hypothetical protein E2C01_042407 [Portunus trituberculatus]|uniref:Uncharacterized protein n=1 Tax=Portunus trituberculatus TaxID=210409 RepID=A0A5B7FUR0_PORTR|nr:hypothetical protein [Portunus trituberculatus]
MHKFASWPGRNEIFLHQTRQSLPLNNLPFNITKLGGIHGNTPCQPSLHFQSDYACLSEQLSVVGKGGARDMTPADRGAAGMET